MAEQLPSSDGQTPTLITKAGASPHEATTIGRYSTALRSAQRPQQFTLSVRDSGPVGKSQTDKFFYVFFT